MFYFDFVRYIKCHFLIPCKIYHTSAEDVKCNYSRFYTIICAILLSRFTLIKERLIEFNQLAMANHDGSEDMLNRVMTKDNIGLAALLETKEAAWENCGK